MNTPPITGDRILADLRKAADRGKVDYGTVEVELPAPIWNILYAEAPALGITRPGPSNPWTDAEDSGPIHVPTLYGDLLCWTEGGQMRNTRIGWGATGNIDGPTREG